MNAREQARSSTAEGTQGTSDPEEIRDDIKRTRDDLGETVTALVEKTDVKQQAQRIAQENPMPLALAGTFGAGFLLGRLLSR
ncbi:MAG: DUF3618 domain-containing protein [Solirubrobacterales bacterium]